MEQKIDWEKRETKAQEVLKIAEQAITDFCNACGGPYYDLKLMFGITLLSEFLNEDVAVVRVMSEPRHQYDLVLESAKKYIGGFAMDPIEYNALLMQLALSLVNSGGNPLSQEYLSLKIHGADKVHEWKAVEKSELSPAQQVIESVEQNHPTD